MKWYFTWHRPKMKASGGAFWPVMAIRYTYSDGSPLPQEKINKTIRHEEGHMKDQLMMLLIPWLVLYIIFWIRYGYFLNPFEKYARYLWSGGQWKPFGWIKFI